MTLIKASCHCGAIIIEAELAEPLACAARCNCSFCRRRQAANVSARTDSVRVLKGADHLALYTWGTHTAKHYFCKICGIYTHHQRYSDPAKTGINLGAIEGVDPSSYDPIAWLDGVNAPSDDKSANKQT